jgi:DamX protein
MPPDDSNAAYFDTPTRAERLQLLLYLVRNADDIIYLRAPAGAGKTRFARRLLDQLDQDIAHVWLSAGVDRDVVGAVVRQLGMEDDDLLQWPETPMAEPGGLGLLLVVDDADQLEAAAFEQLAALHARGGHLLLIGRGGFPQTEAVGDVEFVDLPGFDPAATLAFLRQRAGAQAARINDELAAALHRASRGLPGPLLEALDELLGRQDQRSASSDIARPRRGPVWPWLAGGSVVVVLLAVLVFQDDINGLLEPDRAQAPPLADRATSAVTIARDVSVSADASPDPVNAAPAPVPDVTLPELSRPPARAIASPADRPAPPVAPLRAADPLSSASRDTPPAARDALLETAVHEALSAADAQPAAAGPRPPATLQAQPAVSGQQPVPDAAERAEAEAEGRGAMEDAAAGPATPEAAASEAAVSARSMEPRPQDSSAEVPPAPVVAVPPTPAAEVAPATAAQGRVSVAQSVTPPVPGGGPAPVEERVAATPAQPPTAPAGPTAYRQGGVDWLNSREPGRYTLQLVGAHDAAAIRNFVRDHRVEQPYAIFERQLDGRPWYSLIAGEYPDRNAALAARDDLPGGLGGTGVWPRTFESIRKNQ